MDLFGIEKGINLRRVQPIDLIHLIENCRDKPVEIRLLIYRDYKDKSFSLVKTWLLISRLWRPVS
jgi:hypothetical protein